MKRLLILFLIVLLCTGLGVSSFYIYKNIQQNPVTKEGNHPVNINNSNSVDEVEDLSVFEKKGNPAVLKTYNEETATEAEKKHHAYGEFLSAFIQMSRTDFSGEPTRPWNYVWEPVRVKVLTYNDIKDLAIVKFLGPKDSPKYNEDTSTVHIKCEPNLYYKKVFDGYFENSNERYFDIVNLTYVESEFKKLLKKLDSPAYKQVTLFTYCLDATCDTIGKACMFEDLPEN